VTETPVTEPSLRQRKKERTRTSLIDVSRRLFAEQGYDATTLEQIATEAEVSVPTLLVYFESKERLALARDYDALAELQRAVDDPDREEDTLTLWRRQVAKSAGQAGSSAKDYLKHQSLLASSPALLRGLLVLLQHNEDVLADGLARDFGTDRDELQTRLLATTLAFGNHTSVRRWVAGHGKGSLADACLAVIDFVIDNYPRPNGRRKRAK
jgi:AcrR family transcriptional regulator